MKTLLQILLLNVLVFSSGWFLPPAHREKPAVEIDNVSPVTTADEQLPDPAPQLFAGQDRSLLSPELLGRLNRQKMYSHTLAPQPY